MFQRPLAVLVAFAACSTAAGQTPAASNPGTPGDGPVVREHGFGGPPSPAIIGGGGPNAVLGEGLTDEITGQCLYASSQPRRGMLYPLTLFLNVDLAGRVGIWTTTPQEQLHVQGGDVVVNGELITTWGGAAAVRALGSAATGAGGAVTLLDPLGSATATIAARGPGGGFSPIGWFELLDPSTGDAARIFGQQQTVGAAGRLELLLGGSLRAALNAINPSGLIFTPQLELWNAAGKSTVQLSGSYIDGTGRVALADSAGNARAELNSSAGANLWLSTPDGTGTVSLSGTSDVQAPQAVLRTADGEDTVVLTADFEDSGSGRVNLGVSGVGETLFVDGGSAGVGPEVFGNQKDGSRAFSLATQAPTALPMGYFRLFTEEGAGGIVLSKDGGTGSLDMYLTSGERVVEVDGFVDGGLRARNVNGYRVAEAADRGGYGALRFYSGDADREAALSPGGLALFDAADNLSLQWDANEGSKAAVVPTESYGRRHLYVREGTGAWFEEAGVAVARGGRARVELDPLFLEVVTVSREHPLRVFATSHGDCALEIEADERGFRVRTASPQPVRFSWVVQATRRGFEGLRLEPVVAVADRGSVPRTGSAASEARRSAVPVPVATGKRRVAPLRTAPVPSPGGTGSGTGNPPPPGPPLQPLSPGVATELRDRATGSGRLRASSRPALGCLYPLSSSLYVDPAGPVGFGTASPDHLLTIEGGDALVEGGFSIGLPGAEEVLVTEGSDGLPTLALRDGSGDTTLTIGQSTLSGTRAGLELVDPGPGLALFTSAGTDGIELTDAQTGALAVRLTSNELSAFSESEVRTLRLQGGTDPVEAQLFDASGVEAVRLDSDPSPSGFGGSRLTLRGGAGTETLEIGRRLLAPDDSNAAARMAVGDSIELSTSRAGGVADSGSLVVRDGFGSDTISLDGLAPTGGAELVLNDGVDDRLRFLGRGAFGGPSLEIVDPGDAVLTGVNGQSGVGDSGNLTLYDLITGATLVTFEGDLGGGGVFSVFDTNGVELVRLDAAQGGIYLRDGSTGLLGLRFQGTVLDLMDDAGNVTISYDGATGEKNGVVATEDFGTRRLYAIESPEVWFEDSGRARLEDGSVRVELDPIFLETIAVSDRHPLVVLATPTAACQGLWVEPDGTGFTVRERRGASSGASFDWRVLARRRGAETKRMEAWTDREGRTPEKAEDF